MIRLLVVVTDGVAYVPAPCRGTVAKMTAIFQTNAVEPNDTIIASRDATAVNTLTAVNTAGLVLETGVQDVTNKGLVFDPESATLAERVIRVTSAGAPGAALVEILFDDSAYVQQPPLEV